MYIFQRKSPQSPKEGEDTAVCVTDETGWTSAEHRHLLRLESVVVCRHNWPIDELPSNMSYISVIALTDHLIDLGAIIPTRRVEQVI
jgi:hypothetical protein